MKHLSRQAATMLFGATLLLTGCSGGDRAAGIEGTGDIMASGSVTAFGSIWVNGVRFDTSEAAIFLDDEAISEEDILPGMTVAVDGSVDAQGNARAKTVVVDSLVNGPITSITLTGIPYSELSVLGQTVILPEEVIVDGLELGSLTRGQNVSVSGLIRSDGTILATRLGLREQASGADVEGTVQSIDPAQYRLMLGALEVDYSNAQFVNGTLDQLELGQQLEVEGDVVGTDTKLAATQIRFKQSFTPPSPGSHLVWEGMVEAFTSVNAFMLNGVMVDASQARIHRGNAAQLGDGVRITASGRVTELGIFMADSISLLLPNQTRFSGTVEEVESESGQLTVLGTQFNADAFTAFEDLGPQKNRRVSLAGISRGESVEVYGRVIDDEWVATRIRRINPAEGASSFRGPVGMVVSDSTFYVMGVLIDASNAQGVELVAELHSGQFVAVEGMQTDRHAVQATRIELVGESDCPSPVAAACKAKAVGKPTDKGNGR